MRLKGAPPPTLAASLAMWKSICVSPHGEALAGSSDAEFAEEVHFGGVVSGLSARSGIRSGAWAVLVAGTIAAAMVSVGCTPPPSPAGGSATTAAKTLEGTSAGPAASVAASTAAPTGELPVPKGNVLRVAAASDLRFVLPEVAKVFEQQHPHLKIEPTFAASGTLFAQVSQKAPFDLFLSADVAYPAKLIAEGRAVAPDVRVYAVGRLVLWVAKESPLRVEEGWKVLKDEKIKKIAIANPAFAPYGRAAKAALERKGIYKDVEGKLVLGENIAQTFQFVESGVADVGVVSLSLASASTAKDKGRPWLVPQEDHPLIEQGGVVLTPSENPVMAEEFLKFLLSASAREILEKNGLSAPAEKAAASDGAAPTDAAPKPESAKPAAEKASEPAPK